MARACCGAAVLAAIAARWNSKDRGVTECYKLASFDSSLTRQEFLEVIQAVEAFIGFAEEKNDSGRREFVSAKTHSLADGFRQMEVLPSPRRSAIACDGESPGLEGITGDVPRGTELTQGTSST